MNVLIIEDLPEEFVENLTSMVPLICDGFETIMFIDVFESLPNDIQEEINKFYTVRTV